MRPWLKSQFVFRTFSPHTILHIIRSPSQEHCRGQPCRYDSIFARMESWAANEAGNIQNSHTVAVKCDTVQRWRIKFSAILSFAKQFLKFHRTMMPSSWQSSSPVLLGTYKRALKIMHINVQTFLLSWSPTSILKPLFQSLDWFWQTVIRPSVWQISFLHSPAIAQMTLSLRLTVLVLCGVRFPFNHFMHFTLPK
jgi:hypothetical protein